MEKVCSPLRGRCCSGTRPLHFKKIDEEKLKAPKVANTKELQFQEFLETFIEAATWIADAIDLNTFIDPVSPAKGSGDDSGQA